MKMPDSILLYRNLAEQAARHLLRSIFLEGALKQPLGLLVVERELRGPELANALFRLARTENAPGDASSSINGNGETCQVTVEERAQLWRRIET